MVELQDDPEVQWVFVRALLTNEFLGMAAPAPHKKTSKDIVELNAYVAHVKGSDAESRFSRPITGGSPSR